ncbi:GtrA family protein [Roseateles oligotrophus]|uniref:GtrA family protein n=1 Tax=Roseateles oligotrophus TaxID=1769250 RepID=A0ABT2YDH3_9BURK|nr:GtrA family protein [Roseateles oligotrophus]MCV2368106.1 GtrA family protein [Roseateles oligotrophus]
MSSLLWFGLVGAAAAAVHMVAVWLLVSSWQMAALIANVLGFLLAFGVSFVGHHRLSFGAQEASARQALPRFALVALLGFAANELLYALLLATGLEYRLALFLVLLAVALMTWLLSRFWAFRADRGPTRT